MNPASGPDYLKMREYNPVPVHGRDFIWPARFPSSDVVAPKVLRKMGCPRPFPQGRYHGENTVTAKETIETEIEQAMMTNRIKAPSVSKYWKPAPKPKPIRSIQGDPKPRLLLATCEVCDDEYPISAKSNHQASIQRHHIKPRSEHQRLKARGIGGLHKCVWLCHKCHPRTHQRFTNMCLAEMPWAEVRKILRSETTPPAPGTTI